jgi:hypothetical protein
VGGCAPGVVAGALAHITTPPGTGLWWWSVIPFDRPVAAAAAAAAAAARWATASLFGLLAIRSLDSWWRMRAQIKRLAAEVQRHAPRGSTA